MVKHNVILMFLLAGCAGNTAKQNNSHSTRIYPPEDSQPATMAAPIIYITSKSSMAASVVISPPAGSIEKVPKNVSLQWNPTSNTDTETVAGYNLYYGTETNCHLNLVQVGDNTNCEVSGLEGGTTYYFVATAIDTEGFESDFSLPLIYTTPLEMDLRFSFNQPVTNVMLQASTDLVQWQNLGMIPTNGTWRVTGDLSSPGIFYRGMGTITQ